MEKGVISRPNVLALHFLRVHWGSFALVLGKSALVIFHSRPFTTWGTYHTSPAETKSDKIIYYTNKVLLESYINPSEVHAIYV